VAVWAEHLVVAAQVKQSPLWFMRNGVLTYVMMCRRGRRCTCKSQVGRSRSFPTFWCDPSCQAPSKRPALSRAGGMKSPAPLPTRAVVGFANKRREHRRNEPLPVLGKVRPALLALHTTTPLGPQLPFEPWFRPCRTVPARPVETRQPLEESGRGTGVRFTPYR
jgi:hypothetical protein